MTAADDAGPARAAGSPEPGAPAPAPAPARGWRLRPASEDFLEQIAAAELVLFPDEAWDPRMLREEILHPSRRYVLAVESAPPAQLLGYAGIMLAGDVADLHTIGTLREGRGIGRALLAWCEEQAREGGADRMLLEVREDNTRARAFYERAGFGEIARRPGYYRTRRGAVDALILELVL